MSTLFAQISMSLDGFIAGPNPTLDDPLGKGGEDLHEWGFATKAFNEIHGRSGGEDNQDSKVLEAGARRSGAHIMGRKMFSGGEGPWAEDPNPDAWWGDEPPFHHPVFVLTHHEREPLAKEGGTTFTFVTDGIESALERAGAAAGEKDVAIGGGAEVIQQYLTAGHLDEIQIHLVPILLGDGTRLLEGIGPDVQLECAGVIESPAVTHLSYRVVK